MPNWGQYSTAELHDLCLQHGYNVDSMCPYLIDPDAAIGAGAFNETGGNMGGFTFSVPWQDGNVAISVPTGNGGTSIGDVKVKSTQIVNFYEAKMKENLSMYKAGSRSQSDAIVVYDNAWNTMVSELANLPFGVGQNSITERSPTGIYPYQKWYRDPIMGTATIPGTTVPGTGPTVSVGTGINTPQFSTSTWGNLAGINYVWFVLAGVFLLVAKKRA